MSPDPSNASARQARLFAAIWLPPDQVAELADLLAGHPNSDPQLRFTRPHTWHITLAFLGAAPLGRAVARFHGMPRAGLPEPGPLALRGAGNFGPVTWVGVAAGTWLAHLAELTQRTLGVADRRFQPHVTVARARGGSRFAASLAAGAAAPLRDWRGTSWTPGEVVLVESILGPVPEYPVRARLALPGSAR